VFKKNENFMKKTGLILILSTFIGAFGATDVQALSVSPGRTEVHLSQGQQVKSLLTVLNNHAEEMQVEVSQKNWFLSEPNQTLAVQDWLTYQGQSHFTLKPGEKRDVSITVSCPKKARGLLVGMTSFAYQPMEPGMVTPMISVSLYLTVKGTENKQGEIKSLAARIWEGKLSVGIEVASTGNVHLRPSGHIHVFDAQGTSIAEFQIREGDPVFPGQTRGFIGQGPVVTLAPGAYTLKSDLVSGQVVLHRQQQFVVEKNGDIRMDNREGVAG